MKKIKNLVFDFDGVIYQSQNYHLNKLNKMFDLGLSMREYSDASRGNANVMMRKKEKFKKVDWDVYNKEIVKDFPLLVLDENIKKILKEFFEKYNLFIISSGPTNHISKFLENNGVSNLFQKKLFLEDHFLKTEKFKMLEREFSINSEDTIFITDTIGDIIEARGVGYRSIGIVGGLHGRKLLESENPVCVVEDFNELKEKLSSF